MTQEDKDLLVSLLEKANYNDLLHIYDDKENTYYIDFISIDRQVCISIRNF